MTDPHDEFEERLSRKIRAYVNQGVDRVDALAAVDLVGTGRSRPNRSIGALAGAASGVVLALVIGVAVLVRGNAPPAASGEESPTPELTQLAVASAASPEPSGVRPVETAAPSSRFGTERERSDFFWEEVSDFGIYGFTYDSLADITEDAHLVVVGRVVGVQPGRIQTFEPPPDESGIPGDLPTLFGVVAIDAVLKGEPQSTTPGTILVARTGWDLPPEELPEGEVVLFLKNYAQLREEGGYEPSEDSSDQYYYGRPNGYQCVLRNLGGNVRIVDGPRGWEEAIGPFPSQLDGQSFDDVLARIRTIVALDD